jgi:hypothetical protein
VLIAGAAGILFVGLVTALEHRWVEANRRLAT